jgi:hypothetical protein
MLLLVKDREHLDALALLRRHPGWGAKRVARMLDVSPATVRRWRDDAQLAPAVNPAHRGPRRRGLRLACLHVVTRPDGYDERATDTPVMCHACGVERRPLIAPYRPRFREPDEPPQLAR